MLNSVPNPGTPAPANAIGTSTGAQLAESRSPAIAHYLATGIRAPAPAGSSAPAEPAQTVQTPSQSIRTCPSEPSGTPATTLGSVAERLCREGLSRRQAQEIYQTFGAQALALTRSNPYALAQVPSAQIAFALLDRLAQRSGFAAADARRVRAGVWECLRRPERDGHCAIEQQHLLDHSRRLLGLAREPIERLLNRLLESGEVVCEEFGGRHLVFTPTLHAAEYEIVAHIHRLQRATPAWSQTEFSAAVRGAERALGLPLSPSQRQAVLAAPTYPMCILTGGPGTGKTTLLEVLLWILRPYLQQVALTAPLARVARDLNRRTGQPASTLHRLLGGAPGIATFARHSGNPLDVQLVVVDEMSLVDVQLFRALVAAVPSGAALWLLGDVKQLPSVGPGQVLRDLIESDRIPTFSLTTVHRQGQRSNITVNSRRARQGLLPLNDPTYKQDFDWIIENDLDRLRERIASLVASELPQRDGFDPVADIQVLTPRRTGKLGAADLNARLQRELNPHPPVSLNVRGVRLGLGDRVLQEVNDDERQVYNGETGLIESIDQHSGMLRVRFGSGQITYTFAQAQELTPAYVNTIHRAQGSEFPAVVVPITVHDAPLLGRSLLYTAYARGRRRTIAIGQARAFELAQRAEPDERRVTGLRERLRDRIDPSCARLPGIGSDNSGSP